VVAVAVAVAYLAVRLVVLQPLIKVVLVAQVADHQLVLVVVVVVVLVSLAQTQLQAVQRQLVVLVVTE